MAELITGDDGLPAEEVGAWAKEKHARLRRYLKLASGPRKKFLTGRAGSATFIDLFAEPAVQGSKKQVNGSKGALLLPGTSARP
jgi:hypothetical protein